MPNEDNMSVSFDEKTGMVTVYLRGNKEEIGKFASRTIGIAAGEQYCRKKGWAG